MLLSKIKTVNVTAGQPSQEVSRRSFHLTIIYGLWSLICATLSAPALLYLFLPPRLRRESDWVDAGDITKLAPRVPVEMVFRKNRIDGWKVSSEKQTAWVVKLADQSIVAFGPQCTH